MEAWGPIFEELDQLRCEGILQADRQCRKLCMGNVPWSPELQTAMNRIGYYQRCRLKYCLQRQINCRTLMNWFKKAKIPQPVTSAIMAIEILRQEFITYNTIKKGTREAKILLRNISGSKGN
jgi:hypothetical protein